MPRPIALTGTPGTGKSTVAAQLEPLRTVEVAELARTWGMARTIPGGVEVDLDRLVRRARGPRALDGFDVVVGHLAHLLPLRDIVVLRCHPVELNRRLRAARRGTERSRRENVAAEATDVIRWEAIGRGRRLLQVDTTSRAPAIVARSVVAFERSRRAGVPPPIDWLSDPRVTDYLLDRAH